ncbi:PIG-L deacetylase family protein [Bordetella genomosp. 13]|uniref:GlcNAc-PI de-N-acetylase n=1 Tax=Bordetella genomosp. 13 TaxID=463040 RepID=A0A1W6ZB55_9BORD|nr:PIG-L deacetylase family protein [Bordetella genomosp. 13]ARP94074.1 GlcNAc-PI de-N-acetylase [Bordetella genomosp. 13]
MKVAVLAAHADDEVLGCGGTIAKHVAGGDEVRVLLMTDGVGSRGHRQEAAAARMAACKSACAELGVVDPVALDFPDNAMDSVPLLEVVQAIEGQFAGFDPDVIYTHHAHDLNVDHRVTHEAVMTAWRPQPNCARPDILTFETVSSTEWRAPSPMTAFVPNWYEDISQFLDKKMAAVRCYESEMRLWPHVRSNESLLHLARWRGACVGAQAAEAFVLIRHIGKA